MEKKKNWPELAIGIILGVLSLASIITAYVLNFNKNPFAKPDWYIYVLYIVGAILVFASASVIYKFIQETKENTKKLNVSQMTLIAMQSAITIILYYFVKFNLPFFPGWLDIQVSEIPALITSFIYGPIAGCLVIFIRFIVKLPGTMTAGVGEFADLILGLTMVLISGFIYKKHRTIKGALFGTLIATGVSTILACIANWLILIPAYVSIAHFSIEQLVGMMSYIPNVTVENFMVIYIFAGVLPFNLFRYLIVLALTFLLYKRTHIIFDKISYR